MIGNVGRSKEVNNRPTTKMRSTYLKILSNFPNKTLERELANKQFGGLLIPSDFAESDGTRPETMGLLHTTGCSLDKLCEKTFFHTERNHTAVLRADDLAASCLRGALPGGHRVSS